MYATLYLFGPEHLGGKGNIRQKAEEHARQSGRSIEEVAMEVRHTSALLDPTVDGCFTCIDQLPGEGRGRQPAGFAAYV